LFGNNGCNHAHCASLNQNSDATQPSITMDRLNHISNTLGIPFMGPGPRL
jgi:hypothetical protein